MEAISNAGAAMGVLAKDGVVLVAEKKITSKVWHMGRGRAMRRGPDLRQTQTLSPHNAGPQ